MVDQLGELSGWILQSIGQGYGYDLKQVYKVMVSFSSQIDLMSLR